MNKKSLIASSIISGLVLVIALVVVPFGATAQMYYNGYNAVPRWNSIANQNVVQGQTLSISAFAVDDNGDALSYSTVQLPTNSSFNQANHVFSFTPSYSQLGSFPVTLGVTDNKSAVVYTTFYVGVTTDSGHYQYGGGSYNGYYNQEPYFSGTASHYTISSGSNLRFTVNAVDPENQELRYRINDLPAGASFEAASRAFSWTPERTQRGTYTLAFYATDGYATSVPFNVTITVDGGVGTAQSYYPGTWTPSYMSGQTSYFVSTPSTVAVAGQTYMYAAQVYAYNRNQITYTLTNAPTGAYINSTTGLLTWPVPKNVTNGQNVQFTISATDSYNVIATQNVSVVVEGGTPTIKTVVTQPKTVVQYVTAAPVPTTQTLVATNYYPNAQNVYVNTGRTVTPVNYQYYTGGVYGNFTAMPTQTAPISVFNIAVRVGGGKEMIVSWDTSKPTTGEVVFGYASQARPSATSGQAGLDLNRSIMNYDFTTGQVAGASTRHEISLGKLATNATYYLRVISRADNQTEISREIIFSPMSTPEGSIILNQREGAASAVDTFGNFLISGGFLFFLLLIVIALIIYLIVLNRRANSAYTGPELHITNDSH